MHPMSWRGKAIGGSIGSFFGPWGIMAGATAGHFLVDRKAQQQTERDALRLLALTTGTLYEMALSNGKCQELELHVIHTILQEINQSTGNKIRQSDLIAIFHGSTRLQEPLRRLAERTQTMPGLAPTVLSWLWRVAVCDGDPSPAEMSCLHRFARSAGLANQEVQQSGMLYVRHHSFLSDQEQQNACTLLEVTPDADEKTLKSAYRRLSQTYHPDKHNNLDPAIKALAAAKFTEITHAYRLLAAQKGSYTAPLYVKCPLGKTVRQAGTTALSACFVCNSRCQLPPDNTLIAERCPACQSLLAFEYDLANQLLRFTSARSPQP